jgi:hypothetical protein
MGDVTAEHRWRPRESPPFENRERWGSLSYRVADGKLLSWASPPSLPAWLNEQCYLEKIQPQLRTIKVREIATAMQVSKPYAALIRAGRRRPHPRHWRALAELVGVVAAGKAIGDANHV